MFRCYCVLLFLLALKLVAQDAQTQYLIQVELDKNAEFLTVSQTVIWTNSTAEKVNIIQLNDWSNSFKDTETPLSQRLIEEYDRSFYLAPKTKRGYTDIEKISSNNIDLVWLRDRKSQDQMTLYLPKYVEPNDNISLRFNYRVKIPDDRFTGFGKKDDQEIRLRHWFIAIAPIINGKWAQYSNLNLDDNSHHPSDFKIDFTYPDSFDLESNLSTTEINSKKNNTTQHFYGEKETKAQFIFTKEKKIKEYQLRDGTTVVTDLDSEALNPSTHLERIENIHKFIHEYLPAYPHKKILILKRDYTKNPFYGLNFLPTFLHLFPDHFDFEIEFLKVYIWNYLDEQLQINKRKDHWITGGLETFLIIKYIKDNYPNQKFLGSLSDFPYLKRYKLSDLHFNDSFLFFYEWTQSNNLQQADRVSKDSLLKFNEQKATPYHVGVGLRFLESLVGNQAWQGVIYDYISKKGSLDLQPIFEEKTNQKAKWFFDDYTSNRVPLDFQFSNLIKNENQYQITLSEKKGRNAPVQVGWIKKDSVVKTKWIRLTSKDTILKWKPNDANYIAINPLVNFPETNKKNNWKALKTPLGIKPLSLRFVKDIEDPGRNQLFFNPITDFNAYDGITIGVRLFNGRLKKQLFNYEFSPHYSFLEKSWVGHFRLGTYFYNNYSNNYLTTFQLLGSSYHYNSDLRYVTFTPHLAWYFRTPDFRSNKRKLLSVSWYNVFREKDPEIETSPDYSVLNLRHIHSNKGALKHFTSNSSLEFSNQFGKIQWSVDYRKLFPSGRQFGVRFFAGKFLWYNVENTSYFDFNLNRPTDYLFQYNYLGRSETSGVYSQQFVIAEGGFKSKFENATSNNFMFSTNLTMGIWKWIEAYADFGVIKNRNVDLQGYFDSGVRLNLVPDYLELYLPFASSNGLDLTQSRYATKIRFVLTLDPKALTGLYARKWF